MRFAYEGNLASIAPKPIAPLARTLYYTARLTRARVIASLKPTPAPSGIAPIFVIGCGRSGTTLLGQLLALHPQVKCFNEPFDLWAAINPVTDCCHFYTHGECHCRLDARSATSATKKRFQRLLVPPAGSALVEKSPINALRIGFLEAIAPGARYVHIVRDGVSVAHSIARKSGVTRGMAFRPPLDDWWGVGDSKWVALIQEARAAGYDPGEVRQLSTYAQRGAYEWLISVREVYAWRERLGGRLVELRLDDLIDDPRGTLTSVTAALSLSPADGEWLDQAIKKVSQVPNDYDTELVLPGQIQVDFNEFQELWNFKGRATSDADPSVLTAALQEHCLQKPAPIVD